MAASAWGRDDAHKINFFSTPRWSVEIGVPIKKSTDYLTEMVALDSKVTLDMTELRCTAGVQVLPDRFDFTTSGFYSPTFFGKFSLGTGTIFNASCNPAYYTEYNIVIGLFLRYSPCKWFTLKHSIASMEKIAVIDIGNDNLTLTNFDMALDLQLIFHPIKPLTIAAKFASYDDYRYYLFITPIGKLSLEYDFGPAAIGFDAKLHWIDFFTLSATLSEQEYRLYCKINF